MVERAKVAVLVGLLGTIAGVQFVAVFQSPLPGLRFHVALPGEGVGDGDGVDVGVGVGVAVGVGVTVAPVMVMRPSS